MKRILSVFLAVCGLVASAASVSSGEAARAVSNWIDLESQLNCRLGTSVCAVRTCSTTNGVPFHVVRLEGGGFVVTSSDTESEPILAFSESDDLVESDENPLWSMLRRDLAETRRIGRTRHAAAAKASGALGSTASKWSLLLGADTTNGPVRALHASAGSGRSRIADVRVAPLLKTKWSQGNVDDGSPDGAPCYNFYTPSNYVCGCVATATAQVMRYHRYPTAPVKPGTYSCKVGGKAAVLTMQGGVYEWDLMPRVPADGTTEEERQAIGKLTSDVGIACLMNYGKKESAAGGYMAARCLPERFGYASAVAACAKSMAPEFVRTAFKSNLDAGLPVLVGVSKASGSGGHAIVADGYGYSLSTMYVHFNFGWSGQNDAWYVPPYEVSDYSSVDTLVYNIYPEGVTDGVICSGRVLGPDGSPLASVEVTAAGDADAATFTDSQGIYSFILTPGDYEIAAGDAVRKVALRSNFGSDVRADGSYYLVPEPVINNCCDFDLSVSDAGSAITLHTVRFSLGTPGTRTGGGELVQHVRTGLAAVAPEFECPGLWVFQGWSCDFSSVTCDLTVVAQWASRDTVEVRAKANDAKGGTVSGSTTLKRAADGTFKAVTLKAKANKGYWFAGWYDADGNRASGELSFKFTPDDESDLVVAYEACFLREQPAIYASYTAVLEFDAGLVPVSVTVDKNGNAKATGWFTDGSSLSMNGKLAYRRPETGFSVKGEVFPALATVDLSAKPKALAGGVLNVSVDIGLGADSGAPGAHFAGSYASRSAAGGAGSGQAEAAALRYESGCWIPANADPDFGVVRILSRDPEGNVLTSDDIGYASKNGAVTGLGKPFSSGVTVKFDAKTGLLSLTKGKKYSVCGVLGEDCVADMRFADGTHARTDVLMMTLPFPDESYPWADESASLSLGQVFGSDLQPTVCAEGQNLNLTITGLPTGLKYDAKTGLITGAATKAGTFTVKVTYSFATRKITRTTMMVVQPKPVAVPQGAYAGLATVQLGGLDGSAGYPFAATVDKNGVLTGSITLFGKKATFKANGYETCTNGVTAYAALLDLKPVDKKWGTVGLRIRADGAAMVCEMGDAFGSGHRIVSVEAFRDLSKDTSYAKLVSPYVGQYLMAYRTVRDGVAVGETVFSVSVDKKGAAKVSGTFADGSAFSASSTLSVSDDGSAAQMAVAAVPKSLGAGSLSLGLAWGLNEAGVAEVTAGLCGFSAAKYILASGALEAYETDELSEPVSYRYVSRAWVDDSVDPGTTCLEVSCDNGAFPDARFGWTTKSVSGGKVITGVGKTLNGSKVTFKIDDKSGVFSGKFGTSVIFGAMHQGKCEGTGTVVGKDGTSGFVTVRAIDAK